MVFAGLALLPLFISAVWATPIKRENPQEFSHNKFLITVNQFLQQNNSQNIQDAKFGLLENDQALQGAGNITDPDCLQLATADQAFTNAKAAADVNGQVAALVYRALERDTPKVGQASNACTSIQAVNPEVNAIQQHQDPASDGAAQINRNIAFDLAVQIASVGGDPNDAIESGTFAPGNVNDASGKGNTCNVEDDLQGCIFSQNLLVDDVTPDEIDSLIQSVSVQVNAKGSTDPSVLAVAKLAAAMPKGKATKQAISAAVKQVSNAAKKTSNAAKKQN